MWIEEYLSFLDNCFLFDVFEDSFQKKNKHTFNFKCIILTSTRPLLLFILHLLRIFQILYGIETQF